MHRSSERGSGTVPEGRKATEAARMPESGKRAVTEAARKTETGRRTTEAARMPETGKRAVTEAPRMTETGRRTTEAARTTETGRGTTEAARMPEPGRTTAASEAAAAGDTGGSVRHVLPGEHEYRGVLFFGYSPADVLEAVQTFPLRKDDVFVVSYPKAGTTWMQEVMWLLMHDGDFEGARKKPVYFRSPFLEFKDIVLKEDGLELASKMASPRVIKTHLQRSFMPKELDSKACKTVVVFRNPKDVAVSYYHFYRSSSSFGNFKGTWPEFLKMFLDGQVDHGSWFDFTRSWWEERDNSNVSIVFYEDMKKDLLGEVARLAGFVGKAGLGRETLRAIAEHCSFDSMAANPMTNHRDVYSIDCSISPLLRKGVIGDWRNTFTVAQSDEFDKVYQERLGDLNIPFVYNE